MPEQALYLKYRPQRFEDVIGQEHITRTLRNSLRAGRVRHAYLFSGPRGTGKTTTARLLAKAVNCEHEDADRRPCNECGHCIAVNEGRFLDLIEIDAATHTGVDDVRDLRDKIAFAPGEGRYKIYIIDEVHRFSGSAFDALLKTLEEPPEHAIFVLATTEIDKVPSTIKSRCLQFEFRRVSLQQVTDRLETITQAEGLNIERAALELIARQGTGSVRDSISLLDQIVVDPAEAVTLDMVERILGTASSQAVRDIVDALIAGDAAHGLHVINMAVDSGSDPRQLARQVAEHLRNILVVQTASVDLVDASGEDRHMYDEQARHISRGRLLRALRSFNEAITDTRSGWQPQLALELAFIESTKEDEPVYVATPVVVAQPAQQQKTANPTALPQEEPEPVRTGEPPIIPIEQIRARWIEVQKLVYKYNKNLPALLEHASLQYVDGNLCVLGVRNRIFLDKLSSPERVRVLEFALSTIFEKKIRVSISLIQQDTNPQPQSDKIDDPLLQAGLELGGKLKDPEDDDH